MTVISMKRKQEIASQLEGTGKRPLFQYWEEYKSDYTQTRRSKDTIENTRQVLSRILMYSELISIEDWLVPWKGQDEFFRLAKERKWSESTYNSYRKNLSSYFKHLVKRGHIDENSIKRIDKMTELIQDQPTATNEQILIILNFLENTNFGINLFQRLRDRLFFTLMVITGARPKELLNLRLASFSWNRDEVTIQTAKSSWKKRVYPLNQKIIDLVRAYIHEVAIHGRDMELNTSFFLGIKAGNSWWYDGLRKFLKKVTKSTGVQITAYMLRRHAATELQNKGVDIHKIQHLMGHMRASTTERYIQSRASMNKETTDILSMVIS